MKKDNPQITASLSSWATNLGVNREALKRRLNEHGIVYGDATQLTAAQIFKAMVGDKDAAMTKKLLAEASERERKNREAEGELFELPAIEKKLWNDLLQPLRQSLEQAPEQLAGLCNPADPDVAKTVLRRFVEDLKLKLKEGK